MLIISVREHENNRWKRKEKKKKVKQRMEQMDYASYSENVIAKWFYCAFKLGFLQLLCKASLMFK